MKMNTKTTTKDAFELHREMYERRCRLIAHSHGLGLLQFRNVNKNASDSIKVDVTEKQAPKDNIPQPTT